jgi:hypothetical protein
MNIKKLVEIVQALEEDGADNYRVAADISIAQKDEIVNYLIAQGQQVLAEQIKLF